MGAFEKAKLSLRKFLLDNKEKVAIDLDKMRKKSQPEETKGNIILEGLKEYFRTTPREQIEADWAKSESADSVGPSIEEFQQQQQRAAAYAQPCVEIDIPYANGLFYGYIEGEKYERERDKWISVKDRLPEKEVDVLIIMQKWGTDVPHIYMGSLQYDNAWYTTNEFHDSRHDDGSNYEYITYWMPLPEPPK